MEKFPKLQKMLLAALNQAALDCGMLLGYELSVKESKSDACEKQAFLKKTEDASFIVCVKSQEDYEGTFYLVVTLRDAIIFGSLLLGMPPARVSEKKTLAILEPDDVDAFNEFTNQMIGSFNSIFKPTLPKKVHLKLLESNKFVPGEDEVNGDLPFPDGEYFRFRAGLSITQQELEPIDILIPSSLASYYDLQDNGEELHAEGSMEAGETESESVAEGCTVLVLDNNSEDRKFFQETLADNAINVISASRDADINDFLNKEPIKAILLEATNLDEREHSICIKVKAISTEKPLPVIMCATEWTRTGVLTALKYGASDIIIKPCTGDELKGRLSKFLNSP
jgi:CheY-like chemotaxis protein